MICTNSELHIGCRVIYNEYKFIILKSVLPTNHISHRLLIQSIDHLTIKGELLETWVSIKDVKIDTQYYRDKKLESLLNI